MTSPDEFYRLDKYANEAEACRCGHDWDAHDNDYPYACWHGHKDTADWPCHCDGWQRKDSKL